MYYEILYWSRLFHTPWLVKRFGPNSGDERCMCFCATEANARAVKHALDAELSTNRERHEHFSHVRASCGVEADVVQAT